MNPYKLVSLTLFVYLFAEISRKQVTLQIFGTAVYDDVACGSRWNIVPFNYPLFISARSININEQLRRSSAIASIISLSNIVISILITGVEEALKNVKMMRLAVVVSLIVAGNSLTQRSIYHDRYIIRPHIDIIPQYQSAKKIKSAIWHAAVTTLEY